MDAAGAGPRLLSPHERYVQHHPRLRRGLQLLGATPLPHLQIWISNMGVQGLSVFADHYCYKIWTSSVFNLLKYNVMGGGQSHLYGTEGPLFYFRNAFNNFNFCFILALLFPAILPIAWKRYVPHLFIVVSPMYIWLAFMSLQAHKEER
ncbi:dol-P-Man:Man(6)GlcNAc(2)-PP-Dol alpha-1,2-mannosyltransferase isoform X2 [Canna indica]|uniref:Mannosyltransferase n=1 Tax=Canna indica TaxID=4628 RepID=A0AAQ3Q5F3_9LILI|nr:dol-P-Man:Man(6)GlcNAc(2)-PP-Dol alpha-1,2-mannosyltransferase isoform X2 [Canna indica]